MFLYSKEVELFAIEMGIDISEETNELVTEKSEENEHIEGSFLSPEGEALKSFLLERGCKTVNGIPNNRRTLN